MMLRGPRHVMITRTKFRNVINRINMVEARDLLCLRHRDRGAHPCLGYRLIPGAPLAPPRVSDATI